MPLGQLFFGKMLSSVLKEFFKRLGAAELQGQGNLVLFKRWAMLNRAAAGQHQLLLPDQELFLRSSQSRRVELLQPLQKSLPLLGDVHFFMVE